MEWWKVSVWRELWGEGLRNIGSWWCNRRTNHFRDEASYVLIDKYRDFLANMCIWIFHNKTTNMYLGSKWGSFLTWNLFRTYPGDESRFHLLSDVSNGRAFVCLMKISRFISLQWRAVPSLTFTTACVFMCGRVQAWNNVFSLYMCRYLLYLSCENNCCCIFEILQCFEMLFFLHLDRRLYVNSHFTIIDIFEIGFFDELQAIL